MPPTIPPGVPAADVAVLLDSKFNTVDTNLALWKIQPGLGTVMIEYSNRLSRVWFAVNAGNWDMAKYQLDEMIEIQEVGETTRPKRAPMLKAFEDGYLKPMDAAILAKDKAAFTKAFNAAITGCNACHAASTGTNWASYKYVEVQVPTIDPASYIDWAGAGQDNYIANPPAAAAATPAPALTGNLDAAGVLAMSAGIATLNLLKAPGTWKKLEEAANALETGIASAAKKAGVPIQQTRVGTMFTTFFSETKPMDWNTVKVADKTRFGKFFQKMLENGVYLAPSQFEAGFLSTMHDEKVIAATVDAAEKAMKSL